MPHAPARSVALLVFLLTLMARDLALAPADLIAAGGAALAVYGVLTLGRPLLTRLLSSPPTDAPRG